MSLFVVVVFAAESLVWCAAFIRQPTVGRFAVYAIVALAYLGVAVTGVVMLAPALNARYDFSENSAAFWLGVFIAQFMFYTGLLRTAFCLLGDLDAWVTALRYGKVRPCPPYGTRLGRAQPITVTAHLLLVFLFSIGVLLALVYMHILWRPI